MFVLLDWRAVDLASVLLAGLAAGYIMAMAGLWAGSLPGMVTVDIADFGRRYMVSDRSSAWLFGLFSHLANSVLLVLAWAMVIEPNLAWPRPIESLLWGLVLNVTFAGALVAPLAGLGFMGRRTGSWGFGLTSTLMHALWGLLVGLLYVPL
ncbi:MAG: hypothetical protein ACYC4L_05450 [Chloroflexota bacterium]